MNTDNDRSSPAQDDRPEETVGEAFADYLALVEETIRTQVTADDIKMRIRRAVARAASSQTDESSQAQSQQNVPASADQRTRIDAAKRHMQHEDPDHAVDPLRVESRDQHPKEISGLRDRQELLAELLQLRGSGLGPAVLAGPGGVGKTTLAIDLAKQVRTLGGRVWWISAIDPISLSQGITAVARQLGRAWETEAIGRGASDAADLFWQSLEDADPGWLLIFDEADDPRVLTTGDSPAGIQDLTGWVRRSARGLALVTSRQTDARMWQAARYLPIGRLQESEAARVLLELVPTAGGHAEARALARRLHGHPLDLHLAGGYLRSLATRGAGFTTYETALSQRGTSKPQSPDLRTPDSHGTLTAHMVNLSLDSLVQEGFPQARPILQLASCYASTTIPTSLLNPSSLTGLLTSFGDTSPTAPSQVEKSLRELEQINLLERTQDGLTVHTAITEAGRASMDGPDPSSARIRHAAIELLAACTDKLSVDEPEAWPEYLRLGPHLLSLLETTADRADYEHLGLLMGTTASFVGAFDNMRATQAARILGERALERCAALEREHRAVLRVRHFMAWAIADRGDLKTAEALYQDVYRIRLQKYGADDEDVLNSRHELAWIAGCRQDWAAAEEGYRETLRESIRILGLTHPKTMMTRHELGWAIANRDDSRLGEASEILEAVFMDRHQRLGAKHPRTLTTMHELAWITARQRMWDAAETAYRELLVLRRQVLGEDHPETLATRHELAWTVARQGRSAEAKSSYVSVLNDCRRLLGEDHPQTLATERALDELRRGRIVDAQHLA